MFCPQCGIPLPEGVAFCGSCGTRLTASRPVQTGNASGFRTVWQKFVTSPLMLACAIGLTCQTIVILFSAFSVLSVNLEIAFSSITILLPYLQALIQPIGYVACCVGMWMLYGEGMRKNSVKVRTVCYTVMFAGLCALLTGAVLSMISLLLTYVETMEFLAFGDVVISTIVGVVLGGGFAITLFALLTYLVYKSGRSITYRPRSGLLTTSAVFLFIEAGLTLFSHAILQQARVATTTTLVNMLVVVAIILMGTLLISYRNKCYGKNPGK